MSQRATSWRWPRSRVRPQLRLRHRVQGVERAPERRLPAAGEQDRQPAPIHRDRRSRSAMALAALEGRAACPGDIVHCAGARRRSASGGSIAGSMAGTAASTCGAASRSRATAITTRWGGGWGRTGSARWRTGWGSGWRHDLPIPAVSAGNMPDAAWKKGAPQGGLGPPATASTTGSARDSRSPGLADAACGDGGAARERVAVPAADSRAVDGWRSRWRRRSRWGIAPAHLHAVRDGMYRCVERGDRVPLADRRSGDADGGQDRDEPGADHHRRPSGLPG